ncbi:MAG: hypothetical protein ACJ72L_21830, partial [Marmoricola sp.]
LALTGLLGACSSSGENVSIASAKSASRSMKCAGATDVAKSDLGPNVDNAVTCTLRGTHVTLNWFKSIKKRNAYAQSAKALGVRDAVILVANLALFCPEDPSVCRKVALG